MHRLTRLAGVALISATLTPNLASAHTYDDAVPTEMRDLVTETDFDAAIKAMGPAVASGFRQDLAMSTAASPCGGPISAFVATIYGDLDRYAPILNQINAEFVNPPSDYQMVNPWKVGGMNFPYAVLVSRMVNYFTEWCTFLPEIEGDQDNGLKYILDFAWFYFHNPSGQRFTQGIDPISLQPDTTLATFLQDFTVARGKFMDSAASTKFIPQWIDDPRIEIEDYKRQTAGEYVSWNDFFARNLITDPSTETIPSRPVTMPDRDYVVSAPTDCIMNPLVQQIDTNTSAGSVRALIDNPLELNTVIDVKRFPLSVDRLLGSAPDHLKQAFVGGSGISCVLMPNTYHHFHAPVSGIIEHAEVVKAGTYGYYDFPNWVPLDGNVARLGTDFTQFEVFQRGVIIIKVEYTGAEPGEILEGYVASIPVGLDTIGSVVLNPETTAINASVTRGYTELGNFFYGGSLNIMLFSKGLLSPAIQVRLGNQVGILNAGTSP